MPRNALIVFDANCVTDDAQGNAVPVVPAGWTVQYEHYGWVTLWRDRLGQPGDFAHAWLAVRDAAPNQARGCWVVIGPSALIDALKPRVTRWWETAAALRADGGAIATSIKAAWRDERRSGDSGERVRLLVRIAGFDDDNAETPR